MSNKYFSRKLHLILDFPVKYLIPFPPVVVRSFLPRQIPSWPTPFHQADDVVTLFH